MRLVLAAVVVVGCGSSPGDELTDLERRATQCGVINPSCGTGTPTADVVSCMNSALQTGALAEAGWDEYYDDMDLREHRYVVDGGRVRVFEDSEDPFGGPDEVEEQTPCTGPFAVSTTMAVCGTEPGFTVDGC
jgi:hypothetical protein